MQFSVLAGYLEKMEHTTKRLDLTAYLVELFQQTPIELVGQTTYLLQGKVRPDYEGIEPRVADKMVMRAIAKSSGATLKSIEGAYAEQGDLGAVASSILSTKTQTTFLTQEISVSRVYDTIYKLAHIEGSRSQDIKIKHISSMLNDATPLESKFILKILLGTLRLGVAENTILDALAEAYTGQRSNRTKLEEAYNVCSDLGRVAATAAKDGLNNIETFGIQMYSPVRPMLAERVRNETDALEKMSQNFAAEYKLDGERVQIHMGEKIEVFSRRLERITGQYPDIAENIPTQVRAKEAILEAEAVAINRDTGDFLPFQELMHRRRKHSIEQAVLDYPVVINFFDILYADGTSYLDAPYTRRRQWLQDNIIVKGMARLVPMTRIVNEGQLMDCMENSINAGGEGLMLKLPDSPYRAGSRGSLWLKLKREYKDGAGESLDLVVIGAFHGRGRRTGIYGTLLLAAYDEEQDIFTSICKVGTGFTDEMLDMLYQILSAHIIPKPDAQIDSGMKADVWFAPDVIIEVTASEITISPVHTTAMDVIHQGAGLALRFPKFTGRIRHDKMPQDATNVIQIVKLYREQKKVK